MGYLSISLKQVFWENVSSPCKNNRSATYSADTQRDEHRCLSYETSANLPCIIAEDQAFHTGQRKGTPVPWGKIPKNRRWGEMFTHIFDGTATGNSAKVILFINGLNV